jgi:hypothetical protein
MSGGFRRWVAVAKASALDGGREAASVAAVKARVDAAAMVVVAAAAAAAARATVARAAEATSGRGRLRRRRGSQLHNCPARGDD